jgi:hypothetical protein
MSKKLHATKVSGKKKNLYGNFGHLHKMQHHNSAVLFCVFMLSVTGKLEKILCNVEKFATHFLELLVLVIRSRW